MGLLELKRQLKQYEKKQLIELLATLYKQEKSVKNYLDFFVSPNEKNLYKEYHEKVKEAFFPVRGYDYSLKAGKKAISDFKKFGPSSYLVADLTLFYVETGIQFTNQYGDIDDAFYNSMTSTYESALKLMKKEKLLPQFQERAKKVLSDTKHIGWYFPDNLGDIYAEYYR